ncbi:MAG TPA: polyamine ABC transporter ATP-binding protein, partial [Thermomicrobiales bacterium]|nr:polyamine ABC transporter ATP-binding protein [Thermomicrobiales bacterium]
MTDSSRSGAAIHLINVEKHFGNVVAVNTMNLDVQPGEFLTLLGPSGCGKTTTLRMIGGFEFPSSGEIRIEGQDVAQLPPHKRPVNTVFQQYALFPHMTIEKNVAYGLRMAGVGRKEIATRVTDALAMVRLPDVSTRKPSELSGGQQQRVALARALINRPKVLLLDEPLGALDLKLRKAMQLELKALSREVGATFVYVTHDQEEALTMSDRIAVMSAGNILQIDTPAAIYERPTSRFVADFIGQSNLIDGTVLEIVGESALIRVASDAVVGARTGQDIVAGRRVAISIRPENLVLHTPADMSANQILGTVREVVYVGSHNQVVID